MSEELIIEEFRVFYDREKEEWSDDEGRTLAYSLKKVAKVLLKTDNSFEVIEQTIKDGNFAGLVGLALMGVKPFLETMREKLTSEGFSNFLLESLDEKKNKLGRLLKAHPELKDMLGALAEKVKRKESKGSNDFKDKFEKNYKGWNK